MVPRIPIFFGSMGFRSISPFVSWCFSVSWYPPVGVPSVDPGLGAREAVGGHPRAHSEAIWDPEGRMEQTNGGFMVV